MTGTVSFIVDCASYQGSPDWAKVFAVCAGGAEKVTEGAGATAYTNPRWAAAKPAMKALAPHGFVPLAYMFMDAAESGASQADYFASVAGDLTGFGIVVDLERAPNGSPTIAAAQEAAAELRKKYPGHPVGGYAPHWYTGGANLSFFDWLWASEYVGGSGDPAALYRAVPAAWWAPYGGRSPLMLQFTSQAVVAGISGPVDCSAFPGTGAQLASRVLPAPPQPPAPRPPTAPSAPKETGDGSMLVLLTPGQVPVQIPVWADAGAYKEPSAYGSCSLILAGGNGAVVKTTLYHHDGTVQSGSVTLANGKPYDVIPASGWSAVAVAEVQRLDTKTAVPASATFRNW